MALKDVLARLRQAGGSTGSAVASGHATGKTLIEQGGSTGSAGSKHFDDGGGKIPEEATLLGGMGKTTHATYKNDATLATYATALNHNGNPGSTAGSKLATRATGHHAADVALGPDDPGDWQGKAEDVAPQPAPAPHRPSLAPASGSLVQRLVAAGATVRSWGDSSRGAMSEVEAPAGIPAELLREVEARGWRIIPGGKANAEAEHDSWLAGVPKAELR